MVAAREVAVENAAAVGQQIALTTISVTTPELAALLRARNPHTLRGPPERTRK
jgi:hypothetical protein